MMSQLSKRKQGLTFGSLKVSKEIRYADEQSFFLWGPRFTRPSQRDVLINFAISAFFGIWMAFTGSADWKPLQFLIFSYMFRIFNKLKQFEPPEAATAVEDEDHNRRMKGGKRLLRTFGLVFSCVAISSLAFTGTLNLYEFLGMYIPLVLINSQLMPPKSGLATDTSVGWCKKIRTLGLGYWFLET
ncbi:hypothetical protein O6H91_23G005500 [Diphasiastrum complanatum]|uniref:Uncharacterized protein n=1 Tax=Diphasiastrum complanatum TaxID=34168 RepID=A0ACC2A7T3_DIPCM|nr:hypothetical protein O6H91_23G005500 [Diphasiastrum complanatum]